MERTNDQLKVMRNLFYAFLALVLIMLVGTLGYRWLGGAQYSWLDCFYMTFITLTTIGYNETVDVSGYEYGRLFTIFIGITGIGVLGYVLSTVTAFMLENDLNSSWRRKKMQRQIAQLKGHFIVCGLGFIGSNVARELIRTGKKCVVVDPSMQNIGLFLETNPEQRYVCGDATSDQILQAAGIQHAHGVFAVVSDDSQNLMITLSARQLNPDLRIVARCHDLKNEQKMQKVGADHVISPDYTGGQRMVSAMVRPNVATFLDDMFKSDDNIRIEEVVVPERLTEQPLSVLYHGNQDSVVLAVRHRGDWLFNPSSLHLLQGGDVLMVMATTAGRSRLEQLMLGLN